MGVFDGHIIVTLLLPYLHWLVILLIRFALISVVLCFAGYLEQHEKNWSKYNELTHQSMTRISRQKWVLEA